MSSAAERSRLRSAGPTFYGFDPQTLYNEFHVLTKANSWALADVKELPVRERRYWIKMVQWQIERSEWQKQTSQVMQAG